MKQVYTFQFVNDYPIVINNQIKGIIKAGTVFKGIDHFCKSTGLSDFKFKRIRKQGFVVTISTKKDPDLDGAASYNNNL